ncbi:hypothetical protein [Rhodococcus opacus]|uniref:hypothetical protein n=1 Tax=Rhodococcus opacus TaxID=37919 RepID=UPI0029499271|nr:hypothetical protein [Rhodococcus opacus]MDV6244881.1 hypothetical protein [Rhodococcus opacus]
MATIARFTAATKIDKADSPDCSPGSSGSPFTSSTWPAPRPSRHPVVLDVDNSRAAGVQLAITRQQNVARNGIAQIDRCEPRPETSYEPVARAS